MSNVCHIRESLIFRVNNLKLNLLAFAFALLFVVSIVLEASHTHTHTHTPELQQGAANSSSYITRDN
jgi:hypothetical protein